MQSGQPRRNYPRSNARCFFSAMLKTWTCWRSQWRSEYPRAPLKYIFFGRFAPFEKRLEFEMSGHLSEDQISKLLSGQATAEERVHIQVCDRCRQQVTQLAETLSILRESVRHWAGESKGAAVPA